MPTRKIADLPEVKRCHHPEHYPPTMMVFQPGVYEHECPGCHHVIVFTVRREATLSKKKWSLPPPRTREWFMCDRSVRIQ